MSRTPTEIKVLCDRCKKSSILLAHLLPDDDLDERLREAGWEQPTVPSRWSTHKIDVCPGCCAEMADWGKRMEP